MENKGLELIIKMNQRSARRGFIAGVIVSVGVIVTLKIKDELKSLVK